MSHSVDVDDLVAFRIPKVAQLVQMNIEGLQPVQCLPSVSVPKQLQATEADSSRCPERCLGQGLLAEAACALGKMDCASAGRHRRRQRSSRRRRKRGLNGEGDFLPKELRMDEMIEITEMTLKNIPDSRN